MKNIVIWITGLSGSGKTTLSNALIERLPNALHVDIIFKYLHTSGVNI
jgi:adenylylsulfate kinase-like enzyme